MIEHSNMEGQRMAMVIQPAYASVTQAAETELGSDSLIRRAGKEEIHHSSASYGAVKRSAAITGSL